MSDGLHRFMARTAVARVLYYDGSRGGTDELEIVR